MSFRRILATYTASLHGSPGRAQREEGGAGKEKVARILMRWDMPLGLQKNKLTFRPHKRTFKEMPAAKRADSGLCGTS